MKVQRAEWSALIAALALVGCGDDGGADPEPDAAIPSGPDAGTPDAAPPDVPDQPAPATPPTTVRLSPTGPDAFFGVTTDKDGHFYAAGVVAAGDGSDRAMVVAKFLPSGALDTRFGTAGVASKNVTVGGKAGELARSVVVQSTGKIVVAGAIEHDLAATGLAASDRDLALVRFLGDGTVDESFGDRGVVILDLNDGIEGVDAMNRPAWIGADQIWNVSVYGDDRLLVHGSQRAEEAPGSPPRTDTDWAAVRLTADGKPDDTFNGDGKFLLDVEGGNASARAALPLADGSMFGTGYTRTPSFNSTQPVIYKLNPKGELDETFGTKGYFYDIVLAHTTEVYGVALQGTKLVTIGYGRAAEAEKVDWVSLRLDDKGKLDKTWGKDGVVRVDVKGLADNGRHVVVLGGDKVMLVGSAGQAMDGDRTLTDAMVVVLGKDGAPDTGFGADGRRIYDLGGAADVFWNAAVAPDGKRVGVVGVKGAGPTQSVTSNDDAAVLFVPMAP